MIAHATVYDPAYPRSALAAGTSAAYQHGGDPVAAAASATTTSLSNPHLLLQSRLPELSRSVRPAWPSACC